MRNRTHGHLTDNAALDYCRQLDEYNVEVEYPFYYIVLILHNFIQCCYISCDLICYWYAVIKETMLCSISHC